MIHDYPFLHENIQPKGRITISMGISEFAGQSPEELIISAESSLSHAVTKGGNRVDAYQKHNL